MGGDYVALATATKIGKGDFDEAPLREALARVGLTSKVLAWDDPAAQAELANARVCVLRSTWNYVQNYDAFLAWVDRCAASVPLWNPAPVVRWNSHKGYLFELERAGIPIVPTRFVARGTKPALADLCGDWPAAVIKPAVSAGSFGTVRVTGPADFAAGEAHLEAFAAARDMLVQRYMPSVEDYGERALVVLGGVLSHAVRKSPRFSGQKENVSAGDVPILPDEAALCQRILDVAPRPLLYARVDLVRDQEGSPRLMELELIEPSLFFGRHPGSADRLAAAIARL